MDTSFQQRTQGWHA